MSKKVWLVDLGSADGLQELVPAKELEDSFQQIKGLLEQHRFILSNVDLREGDTRALREQIRLAILENDSNIYELEKARRELEEKHDRERV